MRRDEVSGKYMGLGHLDGQRTRDNTEAAGDPNAGLIAKLLEDRPVAKFLTTAGATIAGGVVAGSLVRRVGRRSVAHAVRNYGRRWDDSLQNYRKVQSYLDELEGIHRRRGRRAIETRNGRVVWRDDPTQDKVTTIQGFHQTESKLASTGRLGHESTESWRFRDELQQRMVREGRRLPYELSGAYVSQKAVFNRLLGNEEQEDVDWSDPLDVGGDIVEESAKNLAFGFAPFAAGQAALRQGWRRAMSYGEQATTGYTGPTSDFSVGMHSTMRMVGHEASDLIQRTLQVSRRSGGALSSALRESASRTRPVTEQLERLKLQPTGVARYQRVAHGASPPPTGPLGQVRTFAQKLRDEWRVRADAESKFSPQGLTQTERIAHATGRLRGEQDDILSGTFGSQVAESDYTKRLKNHLVGSGVDEEVAQSFLRHGRVRAPIKFGQQTHVSRRLRLGQEEILDEGDAFWDTVRQRTDAIVGQGSGRQITSVLEDAVRRADAEFIGDRDAIASRIQQQFGDVYENTIIPHAEDMLGKRKLPFNRVQDPTSPNAQNFLLQQTARRLGINTRTSTGVRRSGRELRQQIGDRGLDPDNPYQLRSYLIDQGDVSPPWNPEGRGVFGMRPLSVNDAMHRGIFRDTEEYPEMQRLTRHLQEGDDTGFALDRARVGGLYEGPTGEVVDVGSIRQGVRNTLDRVAGEFQIPLLKIRPLQLLGYSTSRRMATGPAIRYSGPDDSQIALGDVDDSLGSLWFQRGGGSRGNVVALGADDAGVSPTEIAGSMRPYPTDPSSTAGQFARRTSGDEGVSRLGARSEWRERLDVHPKQEMSLYNVYRRLRLRDRSPDPREPDQLAQLLDRKGKQALNEGRPSDVAYGARRLAGAFRDSGFSRNVLRNVDPGRSISRTMRYGDANLLDMDSAQLRRTVREIYSEDLSGFSANARRQVERARDDILGRWRNAGVDEIDQPTPQAMRTTGMHRRSDELRMDVARYLATKSSIRKPQQGFYDELEDMGRELDDLYNSNLISRQDLAESRAAIASFQLASKAVTQHSGRRSLQRAALDLGESLIEGPASVRQALTDFATHQGRFSGAVGRNLFGRLKTRFGMRSMPDEAVTYNPLSEGQQMLFTPTIGTAFNRNPLRAAAHGLGFTDYMPSQAQYASTMSSWSSHLFTRINDVLKFAHAGVKTGGRYTGSLDMYARGMVGKRVLPAVAGGATALTVDRHLGYAVHQQEDRQGDPIYSPLFMGAAANLAKEATVAASAIWPGGMTGEERRQQLEHGDVPIRRGRYWPLSSQPWGGGDVKYYRPSWYQRLMKAPQYTEQQYGSPLERLMFGYDFSPGRVIDPYHYTDKHYRDRPYPSSGDYFTGPWGPLRGVLNATVGRVLKPPQVLHKEELAGANQRQLQRYGSGIGIIEGRSPDAIAAGGGTSSQLERDASTPAYISGSSAARQDVYGQSATIANDADRPARTRGPVSPGEFQHGNLPTTVGDTPLRTQGDVQDSIHESAFQMEQWAGIYGFTAGAIRQQLGFGSSGYSSDQIKLEGTSSSFGQHAQFWNWDIGGLGDFPSPLEGNIGSLQFSELARRFVGGERRQETYNPIPNTLGQKYPWLPSDGIKNFHTGDPYGSLNSGLLRLPGETYERFNRLHSDRSGRYGQLDRLRILSNVAPYSQEFRDLQRQMIDSLGSMSTYSKEHAMESMRRAEQIRRRQVFTPTKYRHSSPEELDMNPVSYAAGRMWEEFAHMDTPAHDKLFGEQTAYEQWESDNVYGVPFAPWETPIESFVEPSLQKTTQRNPVVGATYTGIVGSMFGATREARVAGGMIGAAVGALGGLFGDVFESATGERYLPEDYKKQVAVSEYSDILEYTRARRNRNISLKHDNQEYARYFQEQMGDTMYGVDVYNSSVEEMAEAVPDHKEEYFKMMAHAPVEARSRVLSTAGRLERRMYQGLWNMPVESKPNLGEYFENRELPPSDWQGYNPRVDQDIVKIKMLQDQGLNASSMGFYPQEVQRANQLNPSYPDLTRDSSARLEDVLQQSQVTRRQIEGLMRSNGVSGRVTTRQSARDQRSAIVTGGSR